MKTKNITISLLFLAMVMAPLAIAEEDAATPPIGPRIGGHGQLLPGPVGEKLGLTEEQKETIKGIIENSKADAKTTKDATPDAMKALDEAAEGGDEAAIAAAAKTLADAIASKAVKRVSTDKAIKAVLTEEQNAQLETMKAEMKDRIQQRREKGGFAGFQRGPGKDGQRMGHSRMGRFQCGPRMGCGRRGNFQGGPDMGYGRRGNFQGGPDMGYGRRGNFQGGPGMGYGRRGNFQGTPGMGYGRWGGF